MAIYEDHTTIQQQQQQYGTQINQQQQKDEEEEDDDEEEDEDEDEDEEDDGDLEDFEEDDGDLEDFDEDDDDLEDFEEVYELLKPFTKKQLYALSKQAIEKHPGLAKFCCRMAIYGGVMLLNPEEVFQKEFEEEVLKRFKAPGLAHFMRKCVIKFPDIAEYTRQQADLNLGHRLILVWSHGYGWDATPESLTFEFRKYGEIEAYQYVTDKHSGKFKCRAFILFKHWSGARKALEQPLKKIGNRMAVCELGLFGVLVSRYLDDNPGLPQQKVQALSLSRKQAGPVPVEYCNEAAMNLANQLGVRRGCQNPQMRTECWSARSLHRSLEIKSQDHFLQMDRVREMREKPEVIVNAMVCKNVHDDIAFSILSKLPGKSLSRFGCVCKSWSHLFENPHFMRMDHNNPTHTSLLLKNMNLLCLLSGEKFETRACLDFPPPQFPMSTTFRIMGSSVNGILGLCFVKNRAVLWNPFTKEIKIVPPSLVEFESPYRISYIDYHGFGYDGLRDDYKVIRYVGFYLLYIWPYYVKNVSIDPLWEIYSLRSDSWKELGYKMPPRSSDRSRPGLCTGRVCHWLGERNKSLVSFDLSEEMFLKTPIPSYMCDDKAEMLLTEINGYVALIFYDKAKTTIEVSILDTFGVKGLWTKLFIIGPLPCVEHLMGVGKEGDIFFYIKDDGLAWFDFSTRMIVHLGLKQHCQIVTYKENFGSLVSRGFEKYGDEDIVNDGQSGKITKVYERSKCRKVQKEDSAAML